MNVVVNSEENAIEISISQMPDNCPHCHFALVPKYLFGYLNYYGAFLSFVCVRHSCSRYFVVEYEPDFRRTYHIKNYILGSPYPIVFPQIIKEISPDFVKLYEQAQAAQDSDLNEICGMGYRKALEFLIKDYIIFKDPDLKDPVENKLLGSCINEYIDSAKIKGIARRAAWLGNDESHYIRKWVDLDVNNLKQLIQLTTHWIESEYLSDEMIKAMP